MAITTPPDADPTASLRAARRQRVFDAMDTAGLDVLVLGRRDSVAYATGVRSLWTAGTRQFGPACVLVADGREVHLLSTWDEGVPPEVPFDHLYGVTWNPAVMGEALGAIPGLADARRIGVDGSSVGFAGLAGRLALDATVVPADDVLQAVRAAKLPAEVELIRTAAAVAAAGVGVAAAALATGASPSEALAAALASVAAAGVTVPTSAPHIEPVGGAASDGRLVRIDLGFLVDGYEGGRGRTVPATTGDPTPAAAAGAEAAARAAGSPGTTVAVGAAASGPGAAGDPRLGAVREAQRRIVEACRPGARGADVRAVAATSGATGWRVRGSGMGFEPPVITEALGAQAVLAEDMVLSVGAEVGGVARRDVVLVTKAGAEPL
jgi:Xaa-Pro dipeptidase